MSDLPYVIVRREPSTEMMEAAQVADMNHGDFEEWMVYDGEDVKRVYSAMLSASSPPVSLEEIVEVLKVVDNDVRHHLRSDEIAPALLRPHAVQAVRSLLSRLKVMDNPEGQ